MKKNNLLIIELLMFLFATAMPISAQVANNDKGKINNHQPSFRTYMHGQVLVKFKDVYLTNAQEDEHGGFLTESDVVVDSILQQLEIREVKPLMPLTGKNAQAMRQKLTHSIEENNHLKKNLSNLYVLEFDPSLSVENVIEQLQSFDNVEYAEPNYIVKACSDYTTEPLFYEQWGLQAIHIPELWNMPIINTRRPVIAILDTGVETTHPDLSANIWQNEDETDDNYDSDKNGFVDDIHGWNFIENNANVEDDNGHGTHCAGIAAATGDNNKGICGANPNALIMPLKILDNLGEGTIESMIQGIDYAVANGADIISLSLNSFELSQALEEALSLAYGYTVILAAAGNDGVCMINDHQNFHGNNESLAGYCPRFPAASKYVIGVMATNESGELASFSNFDCDGPLRAIDPGCYGCTYNDNQSYELKVPGENILSTYIGGSYRFLSGTSMACPMAAGAISRLLQCRDFTHEELLKALTFTSKDNIDLIAAYHFTTEDLSATDFTIEYKGVAMTFVKTSGTTCQLGNGEQPAIDVSTQGKVIIPEEVHGLSVTYISSNAFKDCAQVTEVEVPFNVTDIGWNTFKGCSSLEKLFLNGWTQGCGDAFDETTYSNCFLYVNERYTDFYLMSGPWDNFTHQEKLPYKVGHCFSAEVDGEYYPFVVTSVSPKTVKFGSIWINDATQMVESIDIPSEIESYSITSISQAAFCGNGNLRSVKLPPTIEIIGPEAFFCCGNLHTITIPEKVSVISDKAFTGCGSLKSISLPSSIKFIGEHAFQETGLTSFSIPPKLTSIQPHLLYWCPDLKHVDIPSSIKSIGQGAFADTGLESVVIPRAVEYIGPWAFSGCSSLMQIEIQATTPPTLYYESFTNYSVPLKLPKGCLEIYQTADVWSNFYNMIEIDVSSGDVNHDGTVNISDIMATVNHILGISLDIFFEEEADVNGDGIITISDVIDIVNIFTNSSP